MSTNKIEIIQDIVENRPKKGCKFCYWPCQTKYCPKPYWNMCGPMRCPAMTERFERLSPDYNFCPYCGRPLK